MKRIPTPLLIAALLATTAYAVTPQLPSDPDLVYVRLTASTAATNGNDRPVIGLQKEHFKVSEDNTPQDIVYFSQENLPFHVGILLDESGSGKDDVKAKALSGMKKFGNRDDDFFLLEQGKAPLNDAILGALDTLEQRGDNQKRALVVVNTKSDPGSYSYSKVRDRIKSLDILLYVVGIPASFEIPNDSARQALRDLAELTGGSAFFPSSAIEVDDVYRKIVTALKNQYRIGYRSTNRATDGKWRKIRITGEYRDTVSKKVAKLNIHVKPGYYAPTATKYIQ
jgi:Ca-activated chloride channel family protein